MRVDYRESHLDKGDAYDAGIDNDPFSRYMATREGDLLRRFVRSHFRGRIPHYLDFACGTGRITSVIEPLSECSYGIDVSHSMIEVAARKCVSTRFSVLDITRERPDLPKMDLITAFRFFGNAQDELRLAALTALRQLLTREGYFLLNNHRNPKAPMNALSGARLDLSMAKLASLLRESGFEVLATYGIGAWIAHRRVAAKAALLPTGVTRALESISLLPGVARFCPDMIVVARPHD